MYPVDEKDVVVELTEVPQSSVGAPLPISMGDEFTLLLAYIVECDDPRVLGTPEEPIAVVRFQMCYASMFGPPNDEAFQGHPLSVRGLRPYMAAEVLHSSWIRGLERRNSVHPYHDPKRFEQYHHYIFAFHDSTFECIADGFTISLHTGSERAILNEMVKVIAAKWLR